MRLAKVSLLVLAVATAAGGCSYNRGRTTVRRPEPVSHFVPSQSPADGTSQYEMDPLPGPAIPPVAGSDPPPVPPAIGVSRVKSIGWSRLPNRGQLGPSDCAEIPSACVEMPPACCAPSFCDSPGSCSQQAEGYVVIPADGSPVCGEGCVTEHKRVSLVAKFFGPIRKKLTRRAADSSSSACCEFDGGSGCASGCATIPQPMGFSQQSVPGGDTRRTSELITEPGLIAPNSVHGQWRDYAARTRPNPGLAESLQDPFLDERGSQIPSGLLRRSIPVGPTHSDRQDSVPIPPNDLTDPVKSTQLVIPPQWPRLSQTSFARVR